MSLLVLFAGAGAAIGASKAAALMRFLPRWLQGPLTVDVIGAVDQQFGYMSGLALGDQLFVNFTEWGLAFDVPNVVDGTTIRTGWETDYGIPTIDSDPLSVRRSRVLAKRQGQSTRNHRDFLNYVRSVLLPTQSADPTTTVLAGQYVIYKPADRGWITNFLDVEAGLATAGPAHVGLWLAPWDTVFGLTGAQIDLMAGYAIDILTGTELNGP